MDGVAALTLRFLVICSEFAVFCRRKKTTFASFFSRVKIEDYPMNVRKIAIALLVFFVPICLVAQEDCNNGIDDDNDGLIDFQDPDCTCNGIDIIVPSSLFPNPSFEDNTCNPGFGRASCAVGWVNPSEGSPDYYDVCNGLISSLLPAATCPIPEGEKFFGIADIFTNSITHKEYVGTRLTQPMEAGEVYILSFYVGFVREPDPDWASPPTNFAVYGNTDGTVIDIPFDGLNCPTSTNVDTFGTVINPWSLIHQEPISNSTGLGWYQVRIEFTAIEAYEAILLGPSCTLSSGKNYYFLDNLVLSKRNAFSTDFISVRSGAACNDDLRLEVPSMTNDLSYQWYKDGVALVGAANPVYQVAALPDGNGIYTCMISNAFGCSMSDGFEVNESSRRITFDAPNGLCEGDEIRIALQDNYVSYTWGNGLGNGTDITVTQADDYSVTVVDNDGCRLIGTHELVSYADVQYSVQRVKESAPGASDGEIRIIHENGVLNPGVLWSGGSTQNPLTGLEEDTYCVTVTANERCPVEECIDLELEIQPIVVNHIIEPVRCFSEANGSIELVITGGLAPINISWRNHPDWDGLTLLEGLKAGFYTVIIEDDEGTKVDRTYEVLEPEALLATVESEEATCYGRADASIWIAEVTGGNGDYEFSWNSGPLGTINRLDQIKSATYDVRIVDDKGCEIVVRHDVQQPDAIGAKIDLEHPFCKGADDGSIHISEISGGTQPFQITVNGEVTSADIWDLAGEESYKINLLDDNGCSFEQQVFLANQSNFIVDLGPDLTTEEYFDVHIRAISSIEPGLFKWTFEHQIDEECTACDNQLINIQESTLVSVHVTTIEGCTATDTINIVMTPSKRIYIPTAISPNGDGINDELKLYNAGEVNLVNSIKVYNRTGQKIYDASNLDQLVAMDGLRQAIDRNGRAGGTLVYVMEVEYKDGTTRQLQGDFTVVR